MMSAVTAAANADDALLAAAPLLTAADELVSVMNEWLHQNLEPATSRATLQQHHRSTW
jgi:hypothetical protein